MDTTQSQQPQGTKDNADKAPKQLTAAEAAKQVKRTVIETAKDGSAVEKQVAVKADEVLDFKDYGSHVVVVTKDGQKFSSLEA